MHNHRSQSSGRWWFIPVAGLLAVILCTGMYSSAMAFDKKATKDADQHDCAFCHTCDVPTAKDPCLSRDFCTRHIQYNETKAIPVQKIIVLDVLEKVYDPVYFDHESHASMSEMSGGCENCHHYAPPNQGFPSCAECHLPEGLMGKIEPSLKAAYHEQCMACHNEWDNETHCEFCHRKKVGGLTDEELAELPFIAHDDPLEVKDLIIFETGYDDDDKVPFHHKNHVDLYSRNCGTCHIDESCSSCHVHPGETHVLGVQMLNEADEMHDVCYTCHSDADEDCELCHGRDPDDLFSHDETGWPLEVYHQGNQCSDCHHDPGKYQSQDPRCVTCHFDGFPTDFDHIVTGVEFDEEHGDLDCSDCHVNGLGTHASCEECHDDGREWDAKKGFTE